MLTRLEHFVSSKMIVVFLRFFIYLLEIVNLIPNADWNHERIQYLTPQLYASGPIMRNAPPRDCY